MSDSSFDASFFKGNRERLRELLTGTAPIVITANGLVQRSSDETYTFHQDRSFWYLTGIDLPDVVLVMDKGKEYLIIPDREAIRETFDGAVDKTALATRSGVDDIYGEKDGWKQLAGRLAKVKHAATLGAAPPYDEFWGMYMNPARATLARKLKEYNETIELLDIRQHVARMRRIKQPAEIAALQRAIDITNASVGDVIKPEKLAGYAHEYEVEADISSGFRRRGSRAQGFSPIVASGARACVIHSIDNNAPLDPNGLLLMDVSATWDGYAADISRTVSLNGKPTKRQQQVFKAVFEAQEYAFSLLKPGVLPREYEKKVEQFVGEKLRELGIIKTVDSASVRVYFPHATSHYLGLDAHDAGDYELPLEPGVVYAVEPGIYIPEEGIGVRLEDNVLITEDGCQVLSAALPRALV